MSADLHAKIASELSRRLEVARAAEGVDWTLNETAPYGPTVGEWSREVNVQVWQCDDELDGCPEIARSWIAEGRLIALHDPADSIRRYEAYEAILSHARSMFAFEDEEPDNAVVKGSASAYRAVLRFLAASLGLDTEGSTTDG